MTTKQIAEAVGKPERTVRDWIKRLAAKSAVIAAKSATSSPMSPADYGLDETCAIIEQGMGKNAASLYRENARHSFETLAVTEDGLDAAFKAAVITLTAMAQSLDARLSKIETRIEERQALLPAPQMKPRDHISMLVRSYASKQGVSYPSAWGELYSEFAYRTNSNPRLSAKNRNMAIIDYIEAEGMIETLEAIAVEIMGR